VFLGTIHLQSCFTSRGKALRIYGLFMVYRVFNINLYSSVIFFSLVLFHAVLADTCHVQAVGYSKDYLQLNGYSIHLIDPDGSPDDPNPDWQAMDIKPLVGKTCHLDIAIIAPPFYLAGDHELYVDTFSGSMDTQYVVNLKTCEATKVDPSHQYVGAPHLVSLNRFTYNGAPTEQVGPDCFNALGS
jgi:hypothetical protein